MFKNIFYEIKSAEKGSSVWYNLFHEETSAACDPM